MVRAQNRGLEQEWDEKGIHMRVEDSSAECWNLSGINRKFVQGMRSSGDRLIMSEELIK